MVLNEQDFIPTISDRGVEQLYCFCKSVLFKAGRNIPPKDYDDITQSMVLACLEKLPAYDSSKGVPLGGYLYWPCRGVLSTWANRHWREVPAGTPLSEWDGDERKIVR